MFGFTIIIQNNRFNNMSAMESNISGAVNNISLTHVGERLLAATVIQKSRLKAPPTELNY